MKTLIIILTVTFNLSSLCSQSGWYFVNEGINIQTGLNGLYFNDVNTGYVCGQLGKIYKTTNGGSNWQLLNTGTSINLLSIKFINQNTGICVGLNGIIIKTTNAGETWVVLNSNTNELLSCIRFLNNDIAMVAGYRVMLKTTNCGITWIPTVLPALYLNSVFTVNENVSFAAGFHGFLYPLILKTTNGGTTWDSLPIPNTGTLYDIYFANINTGYVSALDKIEKTTNSGLTWFLTSTPLTHIPSIQCFGPDTVFAAGELFTNNFGVSYSSNGGSTWYGQYTPTNQTLTGIHMINSSTGYMTGTQGVVLKTTSSGFTPINNISLQIPAQFKLYQNFPNPFNPVTNIKYEIPKDAEVTIKVHDLLGRVVFNINEYKKAGSYDVKFDGSNLASGMYFYSFEVNGYKDTKKMVLLK